MVYLIFAIVLINLSLGYVLGICKCRGCTFSAAFAEGIEQLREVSGMMRDWICMARRRRSDAEAEHATGTAQTEAGPSIKQGASAARIDRADDSDSPAEEFAAVSEAARDGELAHAV